MVPFAHGNMQMTRRKATCTPLVSRDRTSLDIIELKIGFEEEDVVRNNTTVWKSSQIVSTPFHNC